MCFRFSNDCLGNEGTIQSSTKWSTTQQQTDSVPPCLNAEATVGVQSVPTLIKIPSTFGSTNATPISVSNSPVVVHPACKLNMYVFFIL